MTARSVRNNNPGNLVRGPAWHGLMLASLKSPEQKAETRFEVFANPRFGFRALAITLLNYQKLHNLWDIASIMARFAPTTENDTDAYVKAICAACGEQPRGHFDLRVPDNLWCMMRGIAVHEAGGWFFDDADLDTAVSEALDEPHNEAGV